MNELVAYKSNLCNLKGLLGLGCIHLLEKEELLPYISRIIEKLNTWLTLEDKESQADNVKIFVDKYEDGLLKLIGPNRMNEFLEDYDYTKGEEGFIQRYFVASWTNVYTTIYLELLYNYPSLFTTSPVDCHDCCGKIIEDSDGNLVYQSGIGNLSSSYVGCGCSR